MNMTNPNGAVRPRDPRVRCGDYGLKVIFTFIVRGPDCTGS